MNFSVGDRVILVHERTTDGALCAFHPGSRGVIIDIVYSSYGVPYAVMFDDSAKDGHSCCDRCEKGHGWFVGESDIVLDRKDTVFEVQDDAAFKSLFDI